jgi:hypothetical protein
MIRWHAGPLAEDRAALFRQTGAELGLADMIIEKDFWVCWTLKRLFGLGGDGKPGLIFKGGTSLSKAYGAIRRFSEDIDLSFDRRDLGYDGDRNPHMEGGYGRSPLLPDLLTDDAFLVAFRGRKPLTSIHASDFPRRSPSLAVSVRRPSFSARRRDQGRSQGSRFIGLGCHAVDAPLPASARKLDRIGNKKSAYGFIVSGSPWPTNRTVAGQRPPDASQPPCTAHDSTR